MEGDAGNCRRPHVLAIPYPMMGHMTPIVQLCKMLIAGSGCKVTIACDEKAVAGLGKLLQKDCKHMSAGKEELVAEQGSANDDDDDDIEVLALSDGLPPGAEGEFSWEAFRRALQAFQQGLHSSFAPHISRFRDVVFVLSDLYLSWTQDVADQLHVPRLAVWVSAPAEFQVYSHAQALLQTGALPFKAPPGREKDIDNLLPGVPGRAPIYHRTTAISTEEDEIVIDGLPSLNRRDFPSFLQIEDASDEVFSHFIEHVKTAPQASMLLFNTFEALDGTVLDALRSRGMPAHPIGPLFMLEDVVMKEQENGTKGGVNIGRASGKVQTDDEEYPECLKWLDEQKPNSVIYAAFGTMLELTMAQVQELGRGLLNSGQAFMWVHPKPREDAGGSREEFLKSCVEEAEGKGLVLEWAPQRRVLKHPAIGAFLSHCGWNSTLETICCGVPMLCLPFHSDQFLHCKLVVDEWKVGLRLEKSHEVEDVALAQDISQLTRELLMGEKGKQLRHRVTELSKQAAESSSPAASANNNNSTSRATFNAILQLIIQKAPTISH